MYTSSSSSFSPKSEKMKVSLNKKVLVPIQNNFPVRTNVINDINGNGNGNGDGIIYDSGEEEFSPNTQFGMEFSTGFK